MYSPYLAKRDVLVRAIRRKHKHHDLARLQRAALLATHELSGHNIHIRTGLPVPLCNEIARKAKKQRAAERAICDKYFMVE